MDITKLSNESVELLSLITGKKLTKKDITPPVLFLANLVIILIGVIYADGKVLEEEKARLKITIHKFIPPKGNVLELTKLMIHGVSKQQLYKKIETILTLIPPLSTPEKLLLISFGYEMSAADGDMDVREIKYLEIVGKKLGVRPQSLQLLEAGFIHQDNLDQESRDEVKYLLNPARFHQLDCIFVKAASEMLNSLLPNHNQKQNKTNPLKQTAVYKGLKEFQQYRQKLEDICHQTYKIFTESSERDLLPNTLIYEVDKILEKIQSQKFRIAAIGEFSQGKSTLLNALLGEEIQPVREIPCSGTVTVLKYGKKKRVICRYKDGKEVEIPFREYQSKVTISESAALGNMSEELALSEVEEIFFEHPDLDLCQSGVEIIDSPGLNEHPNRTAITKKLLEDTDAVIFLTNASHPLTLGERELIQTVKLELNGNNIDLPADNLFVLVNFIDLVRSQKNRRQIRKRLENFLLGEKPIIADESRLHFISAQAALDGILECEECEENEYLTYFKNFTHSIEKFLTVERGAVEIQQIFTKINALITEGIKALDRAEKVLDGKVYLSVETKLEILKKIEDASGRDVKILSTTEKLKNQSIKQAAKSWDKWVEGLGDRLEEKSSEWCSEHSLLWDKEKVIKDYAEGFASSLETELENWSNREVKEILVNNLEVLSKEIYQNLEFIRMDLQAVDCQINSNLNEQFNFAIENIKGDGLDISSVIKLEENYDSKKSGLWENLTLGGLTAGALFMFTGVGFLPIFLAGSAVALISSFLGMGADDENPELKIKQQVYDVCFQKFDKSTLEIFNRICENIAEVFYCQFKSASKVIEQAILIYENLLEQEEKAHQETQEQLESQKNIIAEKKQQLKEIKNQIETILAEINSRR
ncbi:MAG: dynamin family protein [Okeania sp. SIO3I5]|uniref:dynamin family protein n=1 Tax=Okeania sp. SIO3I5 TaxID=2607805 RepID=UPI0013BAF4DF|nr:dynamin family protein [Okeania sp. SIO3I5]NEQ36008.1 dynamin family protein [Okeania sp. SIO3I5]